MDTVSGIGVLDKTVAVLDAVASRPLSLTDLVSTTGLSRATAHRLAAGLEVHGLVRRDGQGRYTLGLRLVGLGRAATDRFPLAEAARPTLAWLRDETGESAQLYVRDADVRLCVAAVDSVHELRTIVSEGARLPIGVGSAGRVLSGELGQKGWVASVAERAPGVASVSAPVCDATGSVIAAVSVSGPVDRMSKRPGGRFGAHVVEASGRIDRAARATP